MEIIIDHTKPEIYQRLHQQFGADWEKGIIIAWNGKIHCKGEPEPQKIVHEAVHLQVQEEMGNDPWWLAYLEDKDFRLEQEKLAYKAEADFIKRAIKNREHRFQYINDIAKAFASPIYGPIISWQEALAFLMK